MKALTVQQPYATLLALGQSTWRRVHGSRRLRPGELLAIHAAKNWWRGEIGGRELAATDPFASASARGYSRGLLASPDPAYLPRGDVLAVARFVRCIPTDGPRRRNSRRGSARSASTIRPLRLGAGRHAPAARADSREGAARPVGVGAASGPGGQVAGRNLERAIMIDLNWCSWISSCAEALQTHRGS